MMLADKDVDFMLPACMRVSVKARTVSLRISRLKRERCWTYPDPRERKLFASGDPLVDATSQTSAAWYRIVAIDSWASTRWLERLGLHRTVPVVYAVLHVVGQSVRNHVVKGRIVDLGVPGYIEATNLTRRLWYELKVARLLSKEKRAKPGFLYEVLLRELTSNITLGMLCEACTSRRALD